MVVTMESMDSDKVNLDSLEVHEDAISTVQRCNIAEVKKLCIFDLSRKLKTPSEYDIGGCYSPDPELWFYFKTSVGPGYNYLLSLYVCHRKSGNFSINVSGSNQLKRRNAEDEKRFYANLSPKLKTYTFVSGSPDECHYIKTFCFSEQEVKFLEQCTLFIPLEIKTNINEFADPEHVRQIKLAHRFGHLLGKKKWTDIVLESTSGQTYDSHQIILAAQSSVLKDMIKNLPQGIPLKLDVDDKEMMLLLEHIYTGTVENLFKNDSFKLLELAQKFDIKGLFAISEYAISAQIKVDNAVAIAVISEKHNLAALQKSVFEFISEHPDVLSTEEWTRLEDVQLTKKLLHHIYSKPKVCCT